ncbi:cytochrome c family protein [Desulfurivibrio dismutans]|uniref:cytochrome c family protein n=1 Tax=Desulfurivibrio dismutans TaxID=1398908 RepID=UPI0023DAC941|nr:cytochrome c family protein [Desulfurivibrio alkaliphilus]MDF1615106.1 cytochrome c family protein [Desulfurivibrio alkaliphilus]
MKTLNVSLFSVAFSMVLGLWLLPGVAQAMGEVDPQLFPYNPSLLRYQPSQATFTPPQTCAGCHPRQYEEWTASMHALAWQDPVYQGELAKALDEVGPEVAKQCIGCHTPAGLVTGEVSGAGVSGLSDMALAGVSCDVCHSVSGHSGWETPYRQPENASLILSPGRDTADGPVRTKYGPYADQDHCGAGFHECVEQPLHKQAELCANCHQVHHYQTHTPLESTYREWKDGPYQVNGITCQDCHMVDIATFLRSADTFQKPQRGEYRHYFNGANFLVYFLVEQAALKAGDAKLAANAREKYEMAVARLQTAADLELTPIYRDEQLAELRVRVKNRRAGHNLPTSLTNIRQIWLEMTVKDAAGKVVMTTGTVDEQGKLPPYVRKFNSEGMGENFHFALDPWEVISFARHDTIPPRGYRDVYYGVNPGHHQGPFTAEVTLRYRQAEQKVAHALLAAVPEDIDLAEIYGLTAMPDLPVVDMVSITQTITADR